MALQLSDTRTRTTRPFVPLVSGSAGIYVCGPTVQSGPHVGHLRSAIAFDVLRRWLLAAGFDVTLIRNVTDIDDKVLQVAARTGERWWAVGERNLRAFDRAYDAVQVLPPTGQPRATGFVPEMVVLMQRLIDAGHAYASGGDVYFDVRSLPGYGALSGQRPDAMVHEEADPDHPKRDPLDFALWKSERPGEPSWPTPWGPGRPGWHLECSAMATRLLGPEFDIHGGGLDLLFPHHENELAQSTGAGDGFARYWLHNGLVRVGGEKMSKSEGNSLSALDALEAVRPQVLRYYLAAPHYRSVLDYSAAGLAEAGTAYERLETFVRNAVERLGGLGEAEAAGMASPAGKPRWDAFALAMDDDLAVPRALGEVHGAVRDGNAALAAGDLAAVAGHLAVTRQMLEVLGLDPTSQWGRAEAPGLEHVVDALVEVALAARSDARARRDFAAADAVRDALAGAGIVVEDTPAGARWHLGGS